MDTVKNTPKTDTDLVKEVKDLAETIEFKITDAEKNSLLTDAKQFIEQMKEKNKQSETAKEVVSKLSKLTKGEREKLDQNLAKFFEDFAGQKAEDKQPKPPVDDAAADADKDVVELTGDAKVSQGVSQLVKKASEAKSLILMLMLFNVAKHKTVDIKDEKMQKNVLDLIENTQKDAELTFETLEKYEVPEDKIANKDDKFFDEKVSALCETALKIEVYSDGLYKLLREARKIVVDADEKFFKKDSDFQKKADKEFNDTCDKLVDKLCEKAIKNKDTNLFEVAKKVAEMFITEKAIDAAKERIAQAEKKAAAGADQVEKAPVSKIKQISKWVVRAVIVILAAGNVYFAVKSNLDKKELEAALADGTKLMEKVNNEKAACEKAHAEDTKALREVNGKLAGYEETITDCRDMLEKLVGGVGNETSKEK